MTEAYLSQQDADKLIAMEKHKVGDQSWDYPIAGQHILIPLLSSDRTQSFSLDVSRAAIKLTKGTYQNRFKQVIILARLDFNGPPHRNPDGQEVGTTHLHIYREGFGDKFAMDLPTDKFSNPNNLWVLLEDFMAYCNITDVPDINRGLFV